MNTDVCKSKSQSEESRIQSADSSIACCKRSAYTCVPTRFVVQNSVVKPLSVTVAVTTDLT